MPWLHPVPLTRFSLLTAFLLLVAASSSRSEDELLFNRDVRPILSDNCYACHGPDKNKREAELRLDVESDATADRGGAPVIRRGDPAGSSLVERITSTDPDLRMPPAETGKSLTPQQIETLKRWIAQGAPWQQYWSLIPPERPAVPAVQDVAWPRNDIDRFIAARWDALQIHGSPDADRRTLIRRLSLDLTGLPPAPADVAAFVADTSPDAYEKLVNRLLASEHFGERMAAYWLDVVRYADSGGYHSDNDRSVWMYRDYVIQAFNRNKPFDQFTVEQLAGDLLPEATDEQRIASGYNRLLQTTEEGGAQPKEYTAKYQADRVRNTSVIWMGITMGCSECHDHKFDPFSTRDFYRMAAFFADVQEKPVGRQDETPMPNPSQAKRLQELQQELAALQQELQQATPERSAAQQEWETKLRAQVAAKADEKIPDDVRAALQVEPGERNEQQTQRLASYFRETAEAFADLRQKIQAKTSEKTKFEQTIPRTLITVAVTPRTVRILPRGNWLDDTGEIVEPGVPESLRPLNTNGRATRLDFARWLVAKDNPLTARVFVNRLWQLCFGKGLVRTPDDFGTQGEWPSHPLLLDWLAVEFQESGWDVKHMLKLIVMSRTYQQASVPRPELRERDPGNRWLTSQNRFRLDAEMVRDNALTISGLLERAIGGPSVKPYQPAGYWQYLNFPKREWKHDEGVNQYRRGLYTHWQRTFLHPSLAAFDASTREECVVERARSNTPLQALVLLNDPTYVEAARTFAASILRDGGGSDVERLDFAFQRALSRSPRAEETQVLQELLAKHRQEYAADPNAAQALLNVGLARVPVPDPVEAAAWTSIARVILNLHETITRN